MPGLPKGWDSLGTDQRRQWLKDRDLVLYGGHLIAAGYWAEHRAAITQERED